jgi:hypothetical protein
VRAADRSLQRRSPNQPKTVMSCLSQRLLLHTPRLSWDAPDPSREEAGGSYGYTRPTRIMHVVRFLGLDSQKCHSLTAVTHCWTGVTFLDIRGRQAARAAPEPCVGCSPGQHQQQGKWGSNRTRHNSPGLSSDAGRILRCCRTRIVPSTHEVCMRCVRASVAVHVQQSSQGCHDAQWVRLATYQHLTSLDSAGPLRGRQGSCVGWRVERGAALQLPTIG